ncbi:MAG: hypothetical protein ACRDTA_24740 [Pseudonocardiaceae bacterium]
MHIAQRRRLYLAVLRRRRRAVVSAVLVASAVIMTVSGVVQWAGVAAAIPWHGASSMLLILLGAGHAIRRVRHGRLADCRVGRLTFSSAMPTGPATRPFGLPCVRSSAANTASGPMNAGGGTADRLAR